MNIKHNQIISLNKQKNVEINKKKFKWTKKIVEISKKIVQINKQIEFKPILLNISIVHCLKYSCDGSRMKILNKQFDL